HHRHPPSSPTRRSSDLRITNQDTLGRDTFQQHEMAIAVGVDQHNGGHASLGGQKIQRNTKTIRLVTTPLEVFAHVQQGETLAPRSEEHTSELQSRENLV